jgi:hypothetical protein
MAKGPTSLSEQHATRTMQAATHGMDWMRQFVEQGLNQTEAMVEGFLATAQRTGDDFDKQASEVRQRSMSLASETLSNTMNFAHKVMRAREPLELVQLQSEFLSHQAQVFSGQAKLLGESIGRGANEVGKMTSGLAEASRRGSEAA